MIKYFMSFEGKGLSEIESPQKNCWIHLESPDAEEVSRISSLAGIPESFIKSALDSEESAHLDTEGNTMLVVVDVPKTISTDGSDTVSTMPLGLISAENYFISVCIMPTTVLNDFFQGKIKGIDTASRAKLTYKIMYNNSARFLYYLRQIDKASDRIKKSLAKSMRNKELLQLVELQNSLVFFSASLTSNYAVILKISNVRRNDTEANDILEDVTIENRQAIEMCSVYREIIKSTMDAFAAVVNNNQNFVMRFLTAITIILSVPMVISGFWGMNTAVPFESKLRGFWIAVGISLIISTILAVFLTKKKHFKS